MSLQRIAVGLLVVLLCGTVAHGQGRGRGGFTGAPANPATLLFREAWTRAPMAQPMTQENLGNQHLRLHIYGNADEIRKTFHPDEDYTYTGETTTNWALTVSDPKVVWDLSGDGRVRFRTRNSGYRFLHVVIRTADGAYFPPTVLENVPVEAQVCSNEAFAPLVVVFPFSDFGAAVKAVNDSSFGLQTGVFTNDLANAWQAFNELEVGGVIVNDIPTYRIDHMPYGGVKDSGLGREGLRWAIEDMTELRIMVLAQPQ